LNVIFIDKIKAAPYKNIWFWDHCGQNNYIFWL